MRIPSTLLLSSLVAMVATSPAAEAEATTVYTDTLADLLALGSYTSGLRYITTGQFSKSDKAGGTFTYAAGTYVASQGESTAGRVFQLTSGYLKREVSASSPVRAEWFATASTTDWRAPIQAAIDAYNRVDLLARTYKITPRDQYYGIFLKSKSIVHGAGKTNTILRMADQSISPTTNYASEKFAILGGSPNVSADDVQITDLTLDGNFDGQTLYTSTANIIPTIGLITIYGPNLLVEDVKGIGYGSNTVTEAFAITSALAYKDTAVARTCATIRDVEMTSPGHNLSLKYLTQGSPQSLSTQTNRHHAEITHVLVGGANSYYDDQVFPYTGGANWKDARKLTYKQSQPVVATYATIDAMTADTTTTTGLVTVTTGLGWLKWDPTSTAPLDNMTVFASASSTARDAVLGAGQRPTGRFLLQPATATPPSGYTTVDNFSDLTALRPSAGAWVKVRNTSQNFWRYPKSSTEIPRSAVKDDVSVFTSATHTFQRRTVGVGNCDGEYCDPAWDTSNGGENENNRWPCEGGSIEGLYIHDVASNPEAWDTTGTTRFVADPSTTISSVVQGITVSESEGLSIDHNVIENFAGTGVFMMSWWNKGLTIADNVFDQVNQGISLIAARYTNGCGLQRPRHVDYQILRNTIDLLPNPYMANGHGAAGIQLVGNQPQSTCTKSLSDTDHPRFDGITISGNEVNTWTPGGTPSYTHYLYVNGANTKLSLFPPAVYIANLATTGMIDVGDNTFNTGAVDTHYIRYWDLPGTASAHWVEIPRSSAIVVNPYTDYTTGLMELYTHNNTDLVGGNAVAAKAVLLYYWGRVQSEAADQSAP